MVDVDGAVIGGLYAAGNAMGSVMGMTYGGHGGTLGPALVFGYVAGRHAGGRARRGAACLTGSSRWRQERFWTFNRPEAVEVAAAAGFGGAGIWYDPDWWSDAADQEVFAPSSRRPG